MVIISTCVGPSKALNKRFMSAVMISFAKARMRMNMRIMLVNATKPKPKARLAAVASTFVTVEIINPSA